MIAQKSIQNHVEGLVSKVQARKHGHARTRRAKIRLGLVIVKWPL